MAVEAASDQQIDCEPEKLRDLDPADVLTPKAYVPGQRIVAAYQYPRLPYALTISATSHASESVITAICESAEIVSVATPQGRMRHRARFWIRSLNLQHAAVNLPENADLWSVMLDNEPIEVRRKQGTYIVPLPATQAESANMPRDLTLVYETSSPRSDASNLWGQLWSKTISQKAPDIGITTLGTTWDVHSPYGTDVVSSGGDFEPEKSLTRPSLVAVLADSIAHNSTSGLGWKLVGLVLAAIFAGCFSLIRNSKQYKITLIEVVVVVIVIGMLIALLLPATQCAREASRRMACTNNLKQIGLALHNYADAYGQFPPAVIGPSNVPRDRQFSWMVALLPFLEQNSLYEQLRLDLPCDHPHNAALLQRPMDAFLCPSSPDQTVSLEGAYKTSYLAVTGVGSTPGDRSTRGIIGFDKGLAFRQIKDGTSNTLLVGEVVDGGPWYAGGYGTARSIDDWMAKETWSMHPGVGMFLFGDASVHPVSEGTDPQLLRSLATASGNEPVNDFFCDSDEEVQSDLCAESPAPESMPAQAAAPQKSEYAAKPITPKDKPSFQAPPQQRMQGGERARLSLRVALETDGGEAIRFRREGGPGQLVIGLQDRTFSLTLQWFMVAAALLAAWICRRLPGSKRASAVIVGLAVPIGLSGLVPTGMDSAA